MRIFLATWLLEAGQGTALTLAGGRRRLVSFFHTKEKEAQFDGYVITGRNDNENIPSNDRSRN